MQNNKIAKKDIFVFEKLFLTMKKNICPGLKSFGQDRWTEPKSTT